MAGEAGGFAGLAVVGPVLAMREHALGQIMVGQLNGGDVPAFGGVGGAGVAGLVTFRAQPLLLEQPVDGGAGLGWRHRAEWRGRAGLAAAPAEGRDAGARGEGLRQVEIPDDAGDLRRLAMGEGAQDIAVPRKGEIVAGAAIGLHLDGLEADAIGIRLVAIGAAERAILRRQPLLAHHVRHRIGAGEVEIVRVEKARAFQWPVVQREPLEARGGAGLCHQRRAELRVLLPGGDIVELRVGEAGGQTVMTVLADAGGDVERALGAFMLLVAGGAASRLQPQPLLHMCGGQAEAGRVGATGVQPVLRGMVGHDGRLVAGDTGPVRRGLEGLEVAGAAAVRQPGMGAGQRPAGPDDVWLHAGMGGGGGGCRAAGGGGDHGFGARAFAAEPHGEQRGQQAAQQDDQRERPGHGALGRHGAAQREDLGFGGRIGGVAGGDHPLGGDQHGVGRVAGGEGEAVAGHVDGRRVRELQIRPVDELAVDLDRDATGGFQGDHAAGKPGEPGVAQHDAKVCQLHVAVGAAADADLGGRQRAGADDVAPVGALGELADDEAHAALTSRGRR